MVGKFPVDRGSIIAFQAWMHGTVPYLPVFVPGAAGLCWREWMRWMEQRWADNSFLLRRGAG